MNFEPKIDEVMAEKWGTSPQKTTFVSMRGTQNVKFHNVKNSKKNYFVKII